MAIENPGRFTALLHSLATQNESFDMLLLADSPDLLLEALDSGNSSLPGQPAAFEISEVANDFEILGSRRWPLVCVIEPHIDKSVLTKLLARVRDLHAERTIHINNCQSWSLQDSVALGFSQLERPQNSTGSIATGETGMVDTENGSASPEELTEAAKIQVFEFDIRTYKPAPDWLNAKNWANPEQWDKNRW